MHRVDPVATVLETYHLLSRFSLFMFDGFHLQIQYGDSAGLSPNFLCMTELLHNMKAPFIFMPNALNTVKLQRRDMSKLKLPLTYTGELTASSFAGSSAGRITILRPLPGWGALIQK